MSNWPIYNANETSSPNLNTSRIMSTSPKSPSSIPSPSPNPVVSVSEKEKVKVLMRRTSVNEEMLTCNSQKESKVGQIEDFKMLTRRPSNNVIIGREFEEDKKNNNNKKKKKKNNYSNDNDDNDIIGKGSSSGSGVSCGISCGDGISSNSNGLYGKGIGYGKKVGGSCSTITSSDNVPTRGSKREDFPIIKGDRTRTQITSTSNEDDDILLTGKRRVKQQQSYPLQQGVKSVEPVIEQTLSSKKTKTWNTIPDTDNVSSYYNEKKKKNNNSYNIINSNNINNNTSTINNNTSTINNNKKTCYMSGVMWEGHPSGREYNRRVLENHPVRYSSERKALGAHDYKMKNKINQII